MYCNNCMNEIKEGTFCTECMNDNNCESMPHHLRPGTILNRKYIVGKAIGEGGFGITYIGRDTTLDIKIAIKEYYPNGYVNRNHQQSSELFVTTQKQKEFFEKGKDRFLLEARSIAKFNQEKGIVDVRDYFEENGTAYIIMEYLDGVTLADYVKQNGTMNATQLFTLMKPVMKSLQKMHDRGIIHRDISPDNIMYLKDGTLKLMDFGSARHFSNEENQLSVVLKVGYAPEEQYRKNGQQGPWTDVYGMCATIYRCVTGVVPEDSLDRLHEDNIKLPSQLSADITKPFEAVLMYGLAVHKENRCKDMQELISYVDRALKKEEITLNSTPVPNDAIYKTQVVDEDYRTQVADTFAESRHPQQAVNNTQTNKPPVVKPPVNKVDKKGSNKTFIAIIAVTVAVCLLIVFACAVLVGFVLFRNYSKGNDDATAETTSYVSEESLQTQYSGVTMINCEYMKYKDAVKELEDMGLKVKTEFEFDEFHEKDTVCSQSMAEGSSMNEGDTVTLYVSKGSAECPYDYSQKVVVSAKGGSSSGKLKLYNWVEGDWKEDFSCSAYVGKYGISSNYGEGVPATPKGTFKLGCLIAPDSFGNSDWPLYQSTSSTCIIDDTSSSLYNMIMEQRAVPAGTHYDLMGDDIANGNCCGYLFIEHNGNGTSNTDVINGNGSAITICGMNTGLSSTYGCVDISSSDFYTLMAALDYSKNPHIELKN